MVLTVYKLEPSPPARAVMMVAEALALKDVEYVDVDLFAKEHLTEQFQKLNPQHTIPTIKDGDFVIWDSHAIAAYLVTRYGRDDSLYPLDAKKRAVIDQRLHFDSGVAFPALRGVLFPVLFLGEAKFRPENLARITAAYEFAEKFLDKPWIAGESVSIADICCVSSFSSMDVIIPIDKQKFPKLSGWLDRCSKLDFYVKANAPGLQMFKSIVKPEYF